MRVFAGLALLLMTTVLAMPGCGPSEADAAAASEPRELTFTIVNESRGDIHSIGLEGANYPMSFRPMQEGETSTIRNKKLELPETLTLHWTDHRGERREGTARVWNNLGASYSGPVILTITDRNKVVLSTH